MNRSILENNKLSLIQNNDINNLFCAGTGGDTNPAAYRAAVKHLLKGKPQVLSQNVGLPDPVIYRSNVATTLDKYLVEVSEQNWKDFFKVEGVNRETFLESARFQARYVSNLIEAETDPLQITIEACREQGVAIVASYRMNSEDWYSDSHLLSDFGRSHPHFRIRVPDDEMRENQKGSSKPLPEHTGALDYAFPEVLDQRLRIFAEVAENYDIDGIEFDFRRWWHMISAPLKNHGILTELVRRTRAILDRIAGEKKTDRLILGVRVGPSINDAKGTEYPGGLNAFIDMSCQQLGLDVATWIDEESVDYVCPSLYWGRLPGLPRIREFLDLAANHNVGIYPTVFPLPRWAEETFANGDGIRDLSDQAVSDLMRRHRDELCNVAMQCFQEGAHGISTYNWYIDNALSPHAAKEAEKAKVYYASVPYMATLLFVHQFLGGDAGVRRCMTAIPRVSGGFCEWIL